MFLNIEVVLNLGGGNRIVIVVKVVVKVVFNVVIGGVVVEVGLRLDFSLWIVEDDLLLENVMEVGVGKYLIVYLLFLFCYVLL